MKRILIWLIRAYQKGISPMMGPSCRFVPSCSQYAIDAIGHYGAIRGIIKSIWRVLRCNPFSKGGYDPAVPKADDSE